MSGRPLARLCALTLALALAACAAYQAQHARPSPPGGGDRPDDPRITRLHGEAAALKAELAREGRYQCCVEPPCTQCLLEHGECHCRASLRQEGPCADCCGECRDGWIDGRMVAGVTEEVHRTENGEAQREQDHEHRRLPHP